MVFSTIGRFRYLLSDSTLIDNCGALYMVNRKELLEQGTFKEAQPDDIIYTRTASFPIVGTRRRVLCNVLDSKKGPNIEDLILEDIAMVEGFYVNIVSEACLTKARLQYIGLNCSLQYRTQQKNVRIKQLKRIHNLVFFKYKPLSSYSSFLQYIPISDIGLVSIVAVLRKGFQRQRNIYDPPQPREDLEELQYIRAGYLRLDTLQVLVSSARNVWICRTARVEYESYALTYIIKRVSRRMSENKLIRLFQYISQDLFDYPTSFDGINQLLVIRDEYSRKLFLFLLAQKSYTKIFNTIRNFEWQVRR